MDVKKDPITNSIASPSFERAVVLAYHSHHVVGTGYAENDHVAFPKDLKLLTDEKFRIVSLRTLVDAIQGRPSRYTGTNARLVALTFDDGPVYDVADFSHPQFGRQQSFLNAMREFRIHSGRVVQPELHATSFVIASPEARRVIESTPDLQYTYLSERSMEDDWWLPAIETGLIGIANHSWDHLHPGLSTVAHSGQARADFRKVLTVADADAQIRASANFIASRTNDRADPFFAFPFGHYNEFLTKHYLPNSRQSMVVGAFSVDPRPVSTTEDTWCIPRYVCGHDWRSISDLRAILSGDLTEAQP
jgi:peptidoglycan/xylan/chitin deacetylase (PgdA/CDA1 family)